MRRNALNTPAAANFREGNAAYSHVRGGSQDFSRPPPSYGGGGDGANVPLRTFEQEHGPVEYYNVQPGK